MSIDARRLRQERQQIFVRNITAESTAALDSTVKHRWETAASEPEVSVPRVSSKLWEALRPLIDEQDPPLRSGRHRGDPRAMLDAMLYRFITGCSWKQLPPGFPHPSSVYRTYRRWLSLGLLDMIVAHILLFDRRTASAKNSARSS